MRIEQTRRARDSVGPGAPRRRRRGPRRRTGRPAQHRLALRPSRARVLRPLHARAAPPHRLLLAVLLGRPDGEDVGRARELQRGAPRQRPARRVPPLGDPDRLLRGAPGDHRAAAHGGAHALGDPRASASSAPILFLPQLIAGVVIAQAWTWIYASEGPLNRFLELVGLGSLARPWLGDFTWALPSIGAIGSWVTFGLCMVLFIAGVQKIPTSLYDAARVDGAGAVREFFAVTLPGLQQRDPRRLRADDDQRAPQLRHRLQHDGRRPGGGRRSSPRCTCTRTRSCTTASATRRRSPRCSRSRSSSSRRSCCASATGASAP